MPVTKKRFYWRAFVSFYMVLSILLVAVSGVVLYIAPPGRIANWSYWAIAALDKARWQSVHTIFAFLFVVTALVHIYFNWRVVLGYIKTRLGEGMRRKWELAASSVVVVAIFGLTVGRVPPFSTVMTVGETLKNSWAAPASEPPVPHAEAWTLAQFADQTKIPIEEVRANLAQAGIRVPEQETTLLALARAHNMTPQQVYVAARGNKAAATQTPLAEGGRGFGGGYGRKTVGEMCTELGVPLETGLGRLRAAGIDASATSNLRDLARTAGKTPVDVVGIVRGPGRP